MGTTMPEYHAEIIPDRLYFVCSQQPTLRHQHGIPKNATVYWLDQDLIYEPFCADFGPCNLGQTWRFCQRVNHLLNTCPPSQPIYMVVGPHPHKRANAAAVVGIHSVLYLNKRAEEAYAPLRPMEPFVGFRDASCGVPTYTLGVADAIRGIARAKDVGFINWHKGEHFNVEEYEHYEQVENGDLNWIVPGKLMAFSGPSATPKHFGGWRTFTPEDYIEYFREHNVSGVVRLNKKMYESVRFTTKGVDHYDLYFPDGTCPSEPILYRFLDIVEKVPGALAVHCKAGLGRTGVLICSYMIKHYGFTAEEAMAYIRICRPGSVIGPQQHYLIQYAPRLLHEGREMRKAQAAAAAVSETGRRATATSGTTAAVPPKKKVISITATSRNVDILAAQGYAQHATSVNTSPVRRSPRLANSTASNANESTGEPSHIISVPERSLPPASPSKPAHARGAPVCVHVEGGDKDNAGTATPPRTATRAPMPSLAATPTLERSQNSREMAISACATPATMKPSAVPPSSTKRLLAPNGQPRKIPMAMDFDTVAAAASVLEDREFVDNNLNMKSDGSAMVMDDNWTVNSKPQHDKNYDKNASRVGAFAAAAGRGASAFVEAFRSAVGAHRSSYNDGSRRN